MIVEWILAVLFAFFTAVIQLVPVGDPPAWLDDASGFLETIWGYGAGLGAWVPWSLVVTVAGAVIACQVIGVGIKFVRIIASFLTAGGGSAA